jgi:citrate lyase subunit beta/citryl-CoA lyase
MVGQVKSTINPYKIRSWLFVPAIKKPFFYSIMGLEEEDKPDVVVFDLEDSVHRDFKEKARGILREFLLDQDYRELLFHKYIVTIRVNSFDTEWFSDDAKLISEVKPDFLGLSKVESPEQLAAARRGCQQLFVPIETIRGLENAEGILEEMTWHDVLVLGYEDLSAELLIERPRLDASNPLASMLMNAIISARRHGITIIDAVSRKYGSQENLDDLRRECAFTSGIGLASKVAIHPSQVAVINSVFDKRPLLRKAEEVLGRFNELTDGSFVVTGENKEMMDTPSYKFYSRILELWNRK